MPRALRHLRIQILIVALLFICGAQWFVFQSVAWASMLIASSQRESLVAAVKETFDGEHPCALCHKVSEAGRREKQSTSTPATVKLDLFHQDVEMIAPPALWFCEKDRAPDFCSEAHRNERPLLQPPRVA